MAPSLCPLSVQDTPCFHCYNLYILGDLLKHVKSAHPLASLVPMLIKLFFFCRCPPFLCFSLVLFFLFLGVGFGLSLAPFWGYLNIISHAFICFIGFHELSKTRLSRLFTYPLTKLPET
jgi:hypothetical protein